jgi:NADH-quinone oxidoreductase subunit H
MTFAMFFLAEYTHIIFMSVFTVLLFMGGWHPIIDIQPLNWLPGIFWLSFKAILIVFVFIWVRGTFPRMRYDQLMALLWKTFLPVSLGLVVWTASMMVGNNALII